MAFAHSANDLGIRHDLVSHLKDVARFAAQFAAKCGAVDLPHWTGLWHDLGKTSPTVLCELPESRQRRAPLCARSAALGSG
jgi:hypothetical protein